MIVTCKGLLFDMDGVLISSIASVNRCWRRWALDYGVPDANQIQIPHGTRAVDIVRSFRPDLDEAQVLLGLRHIEDLELEDTGDLQVLPGVAKLLGSLPQERWTIVTSATRRLMVGRLKAAGLPEPRQLVAGDDVTRGKPHPEPYRTGARILGLASSECVVVEDAPTGVASGKAAGSRVLGVLGTHPAAELFAAGAEWVTGPLTGMRVALSGGDLSLEFDQIR